MHILGNSKSLNVSVQRQIGRGLKEGDHVLHNRCSITHADAGSYDTSNHQGNEEQCAFHLGKFLTELCFTNPIGSLDTSPFP